MKAHGIHHVGITVPDLDLALDFYMGVLGLTMFDPPSPVFDHAELGAAVGVPDAALRQVNLACGNSIVELIEYTSPPAVSTVPVRADARGAAHLALQVDDIEATKAELEGAGVEFLSEVNVVDDGVLAGWRWVYFRDPAGILLELVEVAYHDTGAAERGIAAYLDSRRPPPTDNRFEE